VTSVTSIFSVAQGGAEDKPLPLVVFLAVRQSTKLSTLARPTIKRAVEPLIATPHGGSRVTPLPQLPMAESKCETFALEKGRNLDKAAAYVGVSGRTLEKAEAVRRRLAPDRPANLPAFSLDNVVALHHLMAVLIQRHESTP
jgi:hypothetical protein